MASFRFLLLLNSAIFHYLTTAQLHNHNTTLLPYHTTYSSDRLDGELSLVKVLELLGRYCNAQTALTMPTPLQLLILC